MPQALCDGIPTRYDVLGSGPPLLLFSPGGFDATVEKWSALGVYARTRLLEHLARHFACIVFDRRECGRSGGRLERIGWTDYARQGRALLQHLGVPRAHLLGGCMGCGPVAAFAVAYPQATAAAVLVWPVGGARWRLAAQQRLATHAAFVAAHGLAAVRDLARSTTRSYGEDPRAGPWVAVLRHDDAFADAYVAHDPAAYALLLSGTARTLFDRDTAPGAEPEDLLRCDVPALVVPGRDASHATSAAWYLAECLPRAELWDIAPEAQTEAVVPQRLVDFLHATPLPAFQPRDTAP